MDCCSGERREKTLGWKDLAQRGQTTCSRCMLERKLSAYDAKHLERLLLHNELANAVCLFCDTTALRGHGGEPHTCSKWRRSLPWGAFSVETRKKREASKWRCEECQRPRCTRCGDRPTKPLTYDAGDLSDYICQPCLYPPCAGGCGKGRPAKHRGRREYNVRNMPAWYCPECTP